MEKTIQIAVDLDTGARCVVEIGVRRQINQHVIGLVGDQDPHIDPTQAGQLERRHYRLVGYEIGTGDPNPMLCRVDGVDEHQRCSLEIVRRP